MTTIAADLASFAAEVSPAAIPEAVRRHASMMVLDILASAAGGHPTALAASARGSAADLFGPGETGVWFSDLRLNWLGAAYANSSAASALDIDDGHRGACGHAGAGVVPAVLALAARGGWSGAELLDAIVLGYDVALRVASARVTDRIPGYNSGLWVPYGVAAAAGRLMGLDAAQMTQALAIAGAEAPVGLPSRATRRMGNSVKEGIPWAVIAGLGAAARARSGGTGPDDLLDRPEIFDGAAILDGLGARWFVTENYLKPYACCRYMHAAIDAIAALRQPGREIRSLTLEIFPQGLNLNNEPAPASLEGAQYSYRFSCALAAIRGVEALQPMGPQVLNDPEVLALAARIDLRASPDFAGHFPRQTPARVTMDQGDGPVSREVLHPLGDVANPMSPEQVRAKFLRLSGGLIGAPVAQEVLAALDGLSAGTAAPLFNALRGGPDATRRSSTKSSDMAQQGS